MRKEFVKAILVFIIFAIGASYGYSLLDKSNELKIFSPIDFNDKLVDSVKINSKEEHFIGDFNLINQDGINIDSNIFRGKIYVADFIFTTCPGICKLMTANLKGVNEEFLDDEEIALISHSVKPNEDSVPVLKEYAIRYGANAPKWNIVTGSKKHIYDLARSHYFAAIDDGDGGPKDFIHSENVLLIDKQKRIRGVYDGTNFDEMDQLVEDIYTLKKEYD